jgi:hypothetical protein
MCKFREAEMLGDHGSLDCRDSIKVNRSKGFYARGQPMTGRPKNQPMVELSDGEKLILVMLSELHKTLNAIYKHEGFKADIDPEFVNSTISSGNCWGQGGDTPTSSVMKRPILKS